MYNYKEQEKKSFHFVYKNSSSKDGKFYIGKHSTDNLEDGYLGSGNWVRSHINKHKSDHYLSREIIEFCNFEFLSERE